MVAGSVGGRTTKVPIFCSTKRCTKSLLHSSSSVRMRKDKYLLDSVCLKSFNRRQHQYWEIHQAVLEKRNWRNRRKKQNPNLQPSSQFHPNPSSQISTCQMYSSLSLKKLAHALTKPTKTSPCRSKYQAVNSWSSFIRSRLSIRLLT